MAKKDILLVEDNSDDEVLMLCAFKKSNVVRQLGLYWLVLNESPPRA